MRSSTAEKHICEFKRFKRKVLLSRYGATLHNPNPVGEIVGYDYVWIWKCECGIVHAFEIERHAT
jgi:hypothetical protein